MALKTLTLGAALAGLMFAPAAMAEDAVAKGPHGGKGSERMFEALDTNKDGALNLEEFLAPHQKRFTEIDADKNGSISGDEMKNHHETMREKIKARRDEMKSQKDAVEGDAAKPAEKAAE